MADISNDIAIWSATAGSNQPQGSTNVGTGLDDNLRAIQAAIVMALANKGSDLASASTVDLSATNGLFHDVTGTTTITALGTVRAGICKVLKFEGALTLTHNATSLILPGGANITTADGDIGMFASEGSGNWRCVFFQRAAAQPVQAASDTVAGVSEYAVQSEMETPSSNTLTVTPGRVQFHPGVAKAWLRHAGSSTITASHNISSITDNGTGDFTANFTTSFSDGNYAGIGLTDVTVNSANTPRTVQVVSAATGAFRYTTNADTGAAEDHGYTALAFFGDQ